jgi:hypothetical protein
MAEALSHVLLTPYSLRKSRTGGGISKTVLINAAHASDSPENARCEMEISRMDENNLKPLLEARGVRV